jgi:polyhydroxyalkanoate synthesis regulator phasin
MPASKSSRPDRSQTPGRPGSPRSSSSQRATRSSRAQRSGRERNGAASGGQRAERSDSDEAYARAGLAGLVEQLTNGIIRPLDLVMLSRERIQDTLDEAAARGRLTRSDANELVSELVRRGRQQTDDLLSDLEDLLGRSREQIGSATKRTRIAEPVERLVRGGAGRVRRTVGAGPSLPIVGYDDMTARQVEARLAGLTPAELRKVREYECRHANRKSVLAAVERRLS